MPIPLTTKLENANKVTLPFIVEDGDLKAGYRTVVDLTARDSIHVEARAQGMLVYVVATAEFYILATADVTNTGWSLLDMPVSPSIQTAIDDQTIDGGSF